MGYISSIFSLLFFLAALVSLFWGIYVIRLDAKEKVNQVFFLLSLALSIWALGFSISNSASNLDSALFWRRFASLGMVSIFSFVLHFLLLITGQKNSKKLKNNIYLIYIPALICIYVFTLSPSMAKLQYDLVKTDYALTNVASNTIWNYFYYLYYSLYMILSLLIIWKWKNKLKDRIKIRQANLIFIAILVTSVLASLTDIVSSTFMSKPLPQMAPLFILVPVWAMYYSVRHHDLIDYKKMLQEEMIVTEKEKQKIFTTIAIVFFLGGALGFLLDSRFINNNQFNIKVKDTRSIMYIITGALIYAIQYIRNNSLKEALTIIILVVNIPIITFRFLEFSSVTVWVFPMIILISSLAFSKKTLLISTAIVSIITQRLIWILKPKTTVVIDEYDYILRIVFLLTAFVVGYYVNNIYTSKIKENDFQIKFQKMNARISSDFININKENKDRKINNLLAKMGLFFEADRTYLFLIDYEKDTMTYTHEWCNEGVKAEVKTIEAIPLSVFPWWVDQLKKNQLVSIEDVNTMPKDAVNEQDQLLRQGVKTLVSVPVEGKKRMKGFIGIDSVESFRKWTEQDIKLLNILSNLLSDGLTRVKSEQEIEYMAYYDNLTKLPNRILFKDRVTSAINLARRRENFLSIVFIDLDNFKSVNDTMGHDGGDFLLKEVAKRLKNRVRETDTVARFGGDEFLIMLNDIQDEVHIESIVENIMDMFLKPFNIYGREFFMTGSAGLSIFPLDGEDSESLIKNADSAMYEAKAEGKNGYAFCTDNMKEQIEKDRTISNDLYYALERNELSLYYQPQMDLNNKNITGLEALLRWEHPKLGMIPPKVFIPIAEKNGLINDLGEWVLKTACAQNKKWQDMGLANLKIAVNLSGIQFINANIAEDVSKILKETGLDPKYLELEITESIAIKETDFVIEVLNKLKKIGVSIAIDDFGTEYSSLARLKLLPIDRIKIDMEFIHGIENNDKDKAITSIIISLGKSLGLNVLAEGVETGPQSDFLNQKMCDYVQGYYYYKPMPAEEMEKVLEDTFSKK